MGTLKSFRKMVRLCADDGLDASKNGRWTLNYGSASRP
jgi:hypothetical protein